MRHRKDGKYFGRDSAHRRAMFRNLAANLITHERVITTDTKAKELRRVAEKLITKAKRLGPVAYTAQAELSDGDKARRLHVSRLLSSFIPRWGVEASESKRDLVEKVLVELSKRFADRSGGYTRITKIGPRRGDGAPLSVIEFVDAPEIQDAPAEEPEAAAAAAPAEPEPKPEKKAKAKKAEPEAQAEQPKRAKKAAAKAKDEGEEKAPKSRGKKAKAEGEEKAPKSSKKK